MQRALLALSLAVSLVPSLGGCKDKPAAPRASGSGSGSAQVIIDHGDPHANLPPDAAPPPPGDWELCKAGLARAATAPLTKRVTTIIEACRPCGEWTPILAWAKHPDEGGPDRRVIEQALSNCKAFCSPNAKMRFMGTLDDARAKKARTPWRELATMCKEEISARPDTRYVTAPWVAVDRIARWAATQPEGPALLAAIDLPLPPITQTGVGVSLPEAPVVRPERIDAQITLTTAGLSVGAMPHAKLSAEGILPQGDAYPGAPVTHAQLAAALGKSKTTKAAVFTVPTLPAHAVYELVAAARGTPLVLAAASRASIEGWAEHGVVPVELVIQPEQKRDPKAPPLLTLVVKASPDAAVAAIQKAGAAGLKASSGVVIELHPDATVASLVTALGALAYFEWPRVGLVRITKS